MWHYICDWWWKVYISFSLLRPVISTGYIGVQFCQSIPHRHLVGSIKWNYVFDFQWQTNWAANSLQHHQCCSILHREHNHFPYSNCHIHCKVSKEKCKASLCKNCLFEPSFKDRSNYVNCTTYEDIVTVDDSVVNSGTFKIIMTNRSNRHVKIHKHSMGMLKNCEEDQICTHYTQDCNIWINFWEGEGSEIWS